MTGPPKRVWYASFGSNLSYERFLVYLNGGRARGSIGTTGGARDNTPPPRSITQFTSHELSFGGRADRWSGGGVAFLASEPGDHRTALRLYDVTLEQFGDVFAQENGLGDPLTFDVAAAEANGFADCTDRWYGRALFLGRHQDLPIFTITTPDPPPINPPHPTYVQTIVTGLTSSVDGSDFGFSEAEQVREHLSRAHGMSDFDNELWNQVHIEF